MIFFFDFVYVVDNIDEFPYIEPSLHPWNEAYLIMVNDCFDVFLDSVGKNFCDRVYGQFWRRYHEVLKRRHILLF